MEIKKIDQYLAYKREKNENFEASMTKEKERRVHPLRKDGYTAHKKERWNMKSEKKKRLITSSVYDLPPIK